MSLFVFNSNSRIARGIIRHIHRRGIFDRIVCGDLYPNYGAIEEFLKFRATQLNKESKTQIEDVQIAEKSDLVHHAQNATHFLYVTHNYYRNVPSKLTNLVNAAKITKEVRNLKKFVALTPVEYDHQCEADPVGSQAKAEADARAANPNMVLIKSDLTFGKDSGQLFDLSQRLLTGKPVDFHASHALPSPVWSEDIHCSVQEALTNDSITGKSYLAQGPKAISFREILELIEKDLGVKANVNTSKLQGIISPSSANLLSEALYCSGYIQASRFFKNYQALTNTNGASSITELRPKLAAPEEFYKQGASRSALETEQNKLDQLYRCLFY